MLKDDIDSHLKTAMLARDKRLVSILRSLKSAILYKEVEVGKKEEGLNKDEIIGVLKKERKSRRDSSEIYKKAGEKEKAEEEDYQIEIIEEFLPEEMSEEDVSLIVDETVKELGIKSLEMKDMGKLIGVVRKKNSSVDGSVLAAIIKEKISKG